MSDCGRDELPCGHLLAPGASLMDLRFPIFLPNGRYSGDSERTAAARREQAGISRDHRQRARAGESGISPTPHLSLLRGPDTSSNLTLSVSASSQSNAPAENLVAQSSELSEPPQTSQLQSPSPISRNYSLQPLPAVRRPHLIPRSQCRASCISDADISRPNPDPSSQRNLQRSQFESQSPFQLDSNTRLPPRSDQQCAPNEIPQPSPVQRQHQRDRDNMSLPDPVIELTDPDWPSSPAVTDRDWKLLQNFHRQIGKEVMEMCSRCDKKWFRLKLTQQGVCEDCVRVDKDVPGTEDEPFLYTHANSMDPGPMPHILPELSQVEEMLIARMHCFVEVRQVHGQQYKYRGHICNFLTNAGKIYNTLPLLPEDLQIIIIRPKNFKDDERTANQFRNDFKVRKDAIKRWLLYLRRHHPAYHPDVLNISDENLDALEEEAFVDDEMIIHEIEEEDAQERDQGPQQEDTVAPADNDYEVSAVPNFNAEQDEMTKLRQQLGLLGAKTVGRQPRRQPHMSMPTPRTTPVSEFNKTTPILSWVFPTLYPRGLAEIVTSRPREVQYPDYIRHLLLYKDGRFARHPRWRYVVFNTLMRHRVNTKAGFFVNKLHPSWKRAEHR